MGMDDKSTLPVAPNSETRPRARWGSLAMISETLGVSAGVALGTVFFVFLSLVGAVYYLVETAPPRSITITAGPKGSIFETNALRYTVILARRGVRLKVLTSSGSLENLERLSNPAVAVDVGFIQGGETNGVAGNLVSLGSLAHQPLLVFYRGAPVEFLSDLGGKRLVVGPEGTGTRSLALTLLETNGIEPGGATKLLDWEPTRASKALLEGTVDAVFLMGEAASPVVMRELLRAPDIHLLNFTQADAYSRRFPYLNVLKLPEGGIDLGKNIPPQDVNLIGPTLELIARKRLHPALSDLLLEAAVEVHGKASLLQHKGEFPAPIEQDFPISADAARFYKSGKSFFYRYLPFWLASLVSRFVVVLVPAIVVMVPIVRSIPALYRWRVRARTNRWYRALLTLERDLLRAQDAQSRQEFLKRLDEIENTVNTMKVPAFHGEQFYDLRGHILFVRQLVNRSQAK